MTFDPFSVLAAVLAFCSTVISSIVVYLFRRNGSRHDRSDARITALEDDRVVKLEQRVAGLTEGGCPHGRGVRSDVERVDRALAEHIRRDETGGIQATLKEMSRTLSRVEDSTSVTREDVAELKAQRAADLDYIKNLDASIQRHRREAHGQS